MTGQILVVDDNERNLKLLEALLANEYYDVITAVDGFDALSKISARLPDIILLDVMMPGMNGFEVCIKLKANPLTAHIPIIMVTALSEKEDRVKGLDCGADDFLTKPVREIHLISRVKSLLRMKILLDELRLRDKIGKQIGGSAGSAVARSEVPGSKILLLNDDSVESKHILDNIGKIHTVTLVERADEVISAAVSAEFDLLIISTQLLEADGLRICSQLRSHELLRNIPILALIECDDDTTLIKALEIGVNDYVYTPLDMNELTARVKAQLRKKHYQDILKNNYRRNISMAITDGLTGLYNRHYLSTHIETLMQEAASTSSELSLLILDMDHFKQVNDTYGHGAGDEVLKELAARITKCIRGSDLAARIGGEEFVVVMPKTDIITAETVAERLRKSVEDLPFDISCPVAQIKKTASIGLASMNSAFDTYPALMKRADDALYMAKSSGRNRVILAPVVALKVAGRSD